MPATGSSRPRNDFGSVVASSPQFGTSSGRAQLVADLGSTTVLPDDRATGRSEGLAVPQHDGLSLVGDPDCLQRRTVVRSEGCLARLDGRLPDLFGRVLHPARPGEVLGEL